MINAIVTALLILSLVATGAEALDTGWIIASDFSTFGRIRAFVGDDPWAMSADLATIPGDAIGRHHGGLVYVVGRGGASVLQVYDPEADFALVREFSLGGGRNPQDIAFDEQGEAYISCYDEAVLLRVDVVGETILQTISTAAFADADGLPETGWMLHRQGRLYVTCQKLDRDNFYAPSGPGALLVLDTSSEQWLDMDADTSGLQPIVLTGANPFTRIEEVLVAGASRLRVGCVGFYGLTDGGIDEIDPVPGVSLGYLVTEQQLGGDLNACVSTSAGCVQVVVSDAAFNTSLVRWCVGDGAATVVVSGGGFLSDVAWDGGFQVYLADRTLGAEGLRVVDAASGAELTSGAVPTGLPPAGFILPADGSVAPVPGPGPGGLRLTAPFPNPCNPAAYCVVEGAPGGSVRVAVVDLAGRRLQTTRLALDARGRADFRFDGRDGNGAVLPAGVYRVVVQSAGGFAARTVTLLK